MRLMILAMLLLGAGTAYAQSPMGNVSRTLTENAARTTAEAATRNAAQAAQSGAAPAADAKPAAKDDLSKEPSPPGAVPAAPGADKK